jgi:hypothetical protein
MVMKIAVAVSTCTECPHRRYGSGSVYECMKMDFAPLPRDGAVPDGVPCQTTQGPSRLARATHWRTPGWSWPLRSRKRQRPMQTGYAR